MKHAYLKLWTKEFSSPGLILEDIVSSGEKFVLSFKGGKNLTLILHPKDSLLFLCAKKADSVACHQHNLWKNIVGSCWKQTEIASDDRIIYLHLLQKDIYQEAKEYCLIFECMSKANVILAAKEEQGYRIIDALSKYSYADNPQRQVLPKLLYEPPQTAYRPETEEIRLPIILKLPETSQSVACHSVNEFFSNYYQFVIQVGWRQEQKQRFMNHWQKELRKTEKKLNQQLTELTQAEQESLWKTCLELLKHNLHNLKKGDKSLATINYFDPDLKEIEIPLLKDKTPSENLNIYLKKYQKARKGKIIILAQIRKTEEEISQIKTLLQKAEAGEITDYQLSAGNVSESLKKLGKADSLLRLAVNPNWEIVIGRKATENDLICTQIGKPADWWFHTRIYHGSHILLRNLAKKEPSQFLIDVCCGLAAWFSKVRHSQNVPVDYTQIRFLRKPRKSTPGFVTYTRHQTAFVNPIEFQRAKELLAGYEA